ncbi:MAG TPA: hypothetical protein VNT23_08320, partial [Gaiellaceae bacterium]|nr:hypothetical protein [Gaiellaceae bacterium]
MDLQEVDERIGRIEGQLAALPEEVELTAAIEHRAELTPVHEERRTERERLAREQQRLEDEVSSLRARLAREQERLESGTVTSPREIVALQAEIDMLQRRIATLEDDELEVMEHGEAVDATLAELQVGLDAADARVTAATRARDDAATAFSAELDGLRRRRAELLPGILPEVLARYERLRRSQSGTVVAPFDG